jgi:cytochrome c556
MTSRSEPRLIKQTRCRAIAAVVLSLTAFMSLALAHEGATGVVKERMDLMKSQQKDMKLIGEMAKGKTPFDPAKAAAAARDVESTSKKIPDLFPEGSNGHPSDALDAIWKERDKFKGNAKDLEMQAGALATAIDGSADWKGAFSKVSGACKSCHESFRAKQSEHDHMEHQHHE